LRIYLETMMEKNYLQSASSHSEIADAELLLYLNDRDLLVEYVSSVKTFVPNGIRN